jgi:ADP-ribose pyrophosphatase YjhB (NUDIX family)/Txe/YoeB family toxin of Txe-Axe toxin-antitoxin module
MPKAVSRKQWRMMQAILHGKVKDGPRGRPPASIAAKYTSPGKGAAEQSGEDRGGDWSHEHHKAHAEGKSKKKKKHLHKSIDGAKNAAAVLVLDSDNRILLGDHEDGGKAFPGGHMDELDGGSFAWTALREMKEETGLEGINPSKIYEGKNKDTNLEVFIVESFKGKLKGSDELKNLKWFAPNDIKWDEIRECCKKPMKAFLEQKMGKSLQDMLALEALEKNIIRQKGDAVLEVTHGDALKLVGNGMFRLISRHVKDMTDESFKDFKIDTHVVSVRKHMNDVYSGRVNDGHKVVYQFTNKSLPELTAALMSVFEWYSPEDEHVFDLIEEKDLSWDSIEGGLSTLSNDYKKHNIANIYEEMEIIREQMRNGVAIDLQQTEARMMKLFDKLEDTLRNVVDKHNKLTVDAGGEIDELERKLMELQRKLEEMSSRPEKVEAFSANPQDKDKILDTYYPYLPKPIIDIMPSGKITISFGREWQNLEKENFLNDMRAKVITKKAGK